MTNTARAPQPGGRRDAVHRIAWELQHEAISPGDRASLRRVRPGEIGGPAFWKIAVRHLEPRGLLVERDGPVRQRQELQWSTLLAAMANGPSQAAAPLGRVLAEAEVTEARVLRLLRAHDESLLDTVRAVTHQLAAGGHAFDWADLADLLMSDGAPHEESVRRKIAYDFYRSGGASSRSPQPAKEESS